MTNTKALIKVLKIVRGVLFFCVTVSSCHVKDSTTKASFIEEGSSEVKNNREEKMSVKEFLIWCSNEDNKLSKVKEIADIEYKLSYLPAEAMAFLELRKETYDLPKFRKASENYSEMTYFNFRIKILEGTGELLKYKLVSAAQYENRLKYMSFEMEKDIWLVQGLDTISPGLFHFERAFEVVPYATVMLAFDNKQFNKNEEFTVVYNDMLFENSYVKFNYKNKQLINIPNISGL